MPIDNNDNEKPKKNELWFRNEKTGEWSPMMQVESIECTINLTDEDAAKLAEIVEPLEPIECTINLTDEDAVKLAEIVEPLGELEIVPREK